MNTTSAFNILVPTDFSESCAHAFAYAASLGERFGATLHVLHAVTVHGLEGPRSDADLPDLGPLLDAADRAARANMDAGAAVHGGEAEATVVKVVKRAVNPWEAIVDYAESESIDLIVLAMRSGSGLARFLLGSVTERVLRFAPCPVLVVEKGDHDFVDPESLAVRLSKVVVADDLSDKSIPALRYAVKWLAPYAPEMHLLHSMEMAVPAPYVSAGVRSVFTLDRELRGRLETMLLERNRPVIPQDWTVVPAVVEGKPHVTIPDYARSVEADLLVVAGESRIDLGERVLGGTVERITRHAPCPMLIA